VILEGIVTTQSPAGALNIAPMGPHLDAGFERFVLRPFRTSTTYRNLKERGEGVLHVTDDVLLLARSAVGAVTDVATEPAQRVRGQIILSSCRYYEFVVCRFDDREDRASFHAETVRQGVLREFFGFNRAKHAVIEVAILATRIGFLPLDGIEEELRKHRVVVEKTGGPKDLEAFNLLVDHIHEGARQRGFAIGAKQS
jgi:hypothetical protein